jgi:hypothetical protein
MAKEQLLSRLKQLRTITNNRYIQAQYVLARGHYRALSSAYRTGARAHAYFEDSLHTLAEDAAAEAAISESGATED